MRHGFTTGSCAAAAAKAACIMLFSKNKIEKIKILTPKGIDYEALITDIEIGDDYAECAVVKDGGDDPDVTNGVHIFARVTFSNLGINIDGGRGVGRVTKLGLDQEVGMAAINHVPRQMIREAVKEVLESYSYDGGIDVLISVPEGEEIAKKTFNPKLGIEGGISIIGTSGIVEPMSMQAIKDTIKVELNQKKALGFNSVIIAPGNYGQEFIKSTYGYDIDKSVKCSNFIGDTVKMADSMGFENLLLVGHIGKLIKLSGGIMNTHSKEADCRMELIASAAFEVLKDNSEMSSDDKLSILDKIYLSVTTENACAILKENQILENVMQIVMRRILINLEKIVQNMKIECITFSNDFGILAKSENADAIMEIIKE